MKIEFDFACNGISTLLFLQINPLTGAVAQIKPLDREAIENNPIALRLRAQQVRRGCQLTLFLLAYPYGTV